MTNFLQAIKTLVENPVSNWLMYYKRREKIRLSNEALEYLILDLFADTINESNKDIKMFRFSECFSYIGNDNNPPHIILKNGDAVKIKEVESKNSEIKLTNSYPS